MDSPLGEQQRCAGDGAKPESTMKRVAKRTAEQILAEGRHELAVEFAEQVADARMVLATRSLVLPYVSADLIFKALEESFLNCGEDPDCIWAEPLRLMKIARGDET